MESCSAWQLREQDRERKKKKSLDDKDLEEESVREMLIDFAKTENHFSVNL